MSEFISSLRKLKGRNVINGRSGLLGRGYSINFYKHQELHVHVHVRVLNIPSIVEQLELEFVQIMLLGCLKDFLPQELLVQMS